MTGSATFFDPVVVIDELGICITQGVVRGNSYYTDCLLMADKKSAKNIIKITQGNPDKLIVYAKTAIQNL